ncbi:MAG: hypothetical protein V9G20_03335 [Candidatus Promineifilaceae bacterium]
MQHIRPHLDHLTHKTQVSRRVVFLLALQQAAIHSTQADGIHPRPEQGRDDQFVGMPRQHHLRNRQRFPVRHAQAIHLHRLNAQAGLHLSDGLAAAMHNHHRPLHRRHLLRQPAQKIRLIQFVTANFDNLHPKLLIRYTDFHG